MREKDYLSPKKYQKICNMHMLSNYGINHVNEAEPLLDQVPESN